MRLSFIKVSTKCTQLYLAKNRVPSLKISTTQYYILGTTLGIRPISGINSDPLTLLYILSYIHTLPLFYYTVLQNMAQPVLLCDLQNTSQATTTRYRKPERESRFETSHFGPKPVINSEPWPSWENKR